MRLPSRNPEQVEIELQVNGVLHRVAVEPRDTLADTVRDRLGLTGTNLACEHGVCGSCTVLVDGTAARSCLLLAVQCTGRAVTTVEGLSRFEDGAPLSDLQEAFSTEHALQCGFCTPGFLLLLEGALATDPELDRHPEELERLLSSNLCRCTGYVGIRRAAIRTARARRATKPTGETGSNGDASFMSTPAQDTDSIADQLSRDLPDTGDSDAVGEDAEQEEQAPTEGSTGTVPGQ